MLTVDEAPLLRVFAAVARLGSFTAAAVELKLSKSMVSERVKYLESLCGASLLERTTRRVRLTEEGAEVLEVAERVEGALNLLARGLDARRSEPSGALRVATTSDLGPLLVAPVVARFVREYPKVTVEVLADDAPRDLIESRVDVAVRMGAPRDSSFVVRRLASMREPIVAAPIVAEELGVVARPRELADAPWVRHSLMAKPTMRFEGPHGAVDEVTVRARVEANSGSAVLGLALHGAGVCVLPEHLVAEPLREGRLVTLCPGWVWKRLSLYALTPSRPSQRPALKAFLAMLREQVRRDAARWGAAVDET